MNSRRVEFYTLSRK